MANDRRLIEDYLPIEAISAEASREKSVRKGHISTLHLWWARRPLVACRAAVYGALVPAPATKGGRGPKSDFAKRLCKYPGDPKVIAEAQRHILEAHAERLSKELGKPVTAKDIEEGRAPRPKVLDMFAGGGAIPLEALRLGCEAYALELNPVAHIIELCTLVYPQKYGKPDKNAKGSASDGTWAGLAKEVEHWGKWVLDRVKAEIGDLYPPIPDPKNPPHQLSPKRQEEFEAPGFQRAQQGLTAPGGYLTPVAYLWTRTVRCKNPTCGAIVPLVRQTWLRKHPDDYAALRPERDQQAKTVTFKVIEATSERDLGFDPKVGAQGGHVPCPFCSTVQDDKYVMEQGLSKSLGVQLMAIVCTRPGSQKKLFLSGTDFGMPELQAKIASRYQKAVTEDTSVLLTEVISSLRPSPNARGLSTVTRHGMGTFGELFTERQKLALFSFAQHIKEARLSQINGGYEKGRSDAVVTCLGLTLSRVTDFMTTLGAWLPNWNFVAHLFARHAASMSWDFGEIVPTERVVGSWPNILQGLLEAIAQRNEPAPAIVYRGDARALPFEGAYFDSIVTDPPYYDNIPYADIADFFYVWLRRVLRDVHPEHLASELTPKRAEITALSSRFNGDMKSASTEYEKMMLQAISEANRVLKPSGSLVMVYAHKTTLAWSTLVDALRQANFVIVEAWPLDTEMRTRAVAIDSSALASSIFLVARKREGHQVGDYDRNVRPELEAIVRERVETLWEHGVSGADLVIAAVGAGLRAFTRFARVEYANGEEMPSDRFLTEVEGVVLETLLDKIFGLVGARVSQVDGPSQFYVLWRYAYHASDLDAGEAIVFTYGLPVELDGPRGLSAGARALVEKKKNKYLLRDYTERGQDDRLGLPAQDGTLAPLIDVLHRVLYLVENQPSALPQFLSEVQPDLERLRLVANALAGPQLKGGENGVPHVATTAREQAALGKLVANWRSLMEGRITPAERAGVTRRLPGL